MKKTVYFGMLLLATACLNTGRLAAQTIGRASSLQASRSSPPAQIGSAAFDEEPADDPLDFELPLFPAEGRRESGAPPEGHPYSTSAALPGHDAFGAALNCDDCLPCDAYVPCEVLASCWSARVSAIFLHRSAANSGKLVTKKRCVAACPSPDCCCYCCDSCPLGESFCPPPVESFNADEADLGFGSGVLTSIVWHHCCGCDFEARYFGVDGFDSEDVLTGHLNFAEADICDGRLEIDTHSRLRSLELNAYGNMDCWTRFVAGPRWIQLNEKFAGGVPAVIHRSLHADNDLIGCQLGLERVLWDCGGCFTACGTIKGGIFNNIIEQSGSGYAHADAEERTVAFVGELELASTYQWNDHLAVIAGYHLLWLDGVDLAIEQLPQPHGGIDKGSAFYHGASIGFTCCW